MAKFLSTVVLDAAATVIRDNVLHISVMSAAPTETSGSTGIAECNTTAGSMLAMASLTTGSGSTSFTIADSSVSGRKITIAEKASIAIEATGVAAYVAIFSSAASHVYAYTSCATQALTDTASRIDKTYNSTLFMVSPFEILVFLCGDNPAP